jgi:hypothetical protein
MLAWIRVLQHERGRVILQSLRPVIQPAKHVAAIHQDDAESRIKRDGGTEVLESIWHAAEFRVGQATIRQGYGVLRCLHQRRRNRVNLLVVMLLRIEEEYTVGDGQLVAHMRSPGFPPQRMADQ